MQMRRFFRLLQLPRESVEHRALRHRIIETHVPMVRSLAVRFRGNGERVEDLIQVGCIGLVKSVDRFDPNRHVKFTSFATPMITGEIKQYFRDKSWMVRPPRRLQELRLEMKAADDTLSANLDRRPTTAELAAYIGASENDIRAGLGVIRNRRPISLDVPEGRDKLWSLANCLGGEDVLLDRVEDREALRSLLAELPDSDRKILLWRFFEDKTQEEIAREFGVSQMQVSRLLGRILMRLREAADVARDESLRTERNGRCHQSA